MDTPFQWTKQLASHLGGTRNLRWIDCSYRPRRCTSRAPLRLRTGAAGHAAHDAYLDASNKRAASALLTVAP